MTRKIVLTDHAWPDVRIERDIAEAAGFELIAAQIKPADPTAVEALIAEHNPVAIMTCWAEVSARAIAIPTELKVVARLGVGLDNIAIAAASARGAWVTNVPDYCVEEVSDHVVAMVLHHWRGIGVFDREVKEGRWQPSRAQLVRTRDKTIGIIGYGRIGRLTAHKFAAGFGCRVCVYSPSLVDRHRKGTEIEDGIYVADLDALCRDADAIVLHLPLVTQGGANNYHMIDAAFLNACERKPLIVNVSRGGLVDNEALMRALDAGTISGAALDVIEGEPNPPAKLVKRANVVVTPHIAFSSDASLRELRERCTQDVVRVLHGEKPLQPCNRPG